MNIAIENGIWWMQRKATAKKVEAEKEKQYSKNAKKEKTCTKFADVWNMK